MCDDDDDDDDDNNSSSSSNNNNNNNNTDYYWRDIRIASWPGCVAHTKDEKFTGSKDFFSED